MEPILFVQFQPCSFPITRRTKAMPSQIIASKEVAILIAEMNSMSLMPMAAKAIIQPNTKSIMRSGLYSGVFSGQENFIASLARQSLNNYSNNKTNGYP